MSDEDDWNPQSETNTSISPDEDEFLSKRTRPRRSPRRRSNSLKQNQIIDSTDSDEAPKPPPRRSPRRKSAEKKSKVPMTLDLATSSDDDAMPPITHVIDTMSVTKPKRKRNSSSSSKTKRRNSSLSKKQSTALPPDPMDEDIHDGDIDNDDEEPDVPPPKETQKRGRKRKSEEKNEEEPQSKRRKVESGKSEFDEITETETTNTSIPKTVKSTKSTKSTKSSKSNASSSSTTKSAKTPKTKSKSKSVKSSGNLKGQDATQWIREFMRTENRPHSKSSVKNNIPPKTVKIGDAQIKKSLDELKEDEALSHRQFGKKAKTDIYWWNQDLIDLDEGKMERITSRKKEIAKIIAEKKEKKAALRRDYQNTTRTPTDDQLKEKQTTTALEMKELDTKLEEINGVKGRRVTEEEVDAQLVRFHKYGKEWKERRQLVYNMLSTAWGESSKTPTKVLTDTCKGETDKENDVNWDDYKEIYKRSCVAAQQLKDRKKRK